MGISKKITKDKSIEDIPLILCRECKRETNHAILNSTEIAGTDEDPNFSFYWTDIYQITQCKGCDSITFRQVHTNSEDYYQEYTGNGSEFETFANEKIDLYPDPNSNRDPISGYHIQDGNIQRIYLETLKALHSSQPVLCGVGIRAIIETICKDKETTGNLSQKIDQLVNLGVLTKDGAEILHKLRVMGNESAHEVRPHKIDKLNLAINIVDHLLMGVYILPAYAKDKLS